MYFIDVFKQSTHQRILLSFGKIYIFDIKFGDESIWFVCVCVCVQERSIQFGETTIKPNATDDNNYIMQYSHMCNIILPGTGYREPEWLMVFYYLRRQRELNEKSKNQSEGERMSLSSKTNHIKMKNLC